MPSIKSNIIYSSVLTVANYLFPLITYPYVTRVLGVANIGLCNFVDSVVSYFILFSMMGMTTLGIREVAKAKEDKEKLSSVFSSLLVINFFATFIVITIFAASIFLVPRFSECRSLLFIGIIKVIFNYLLIEWFYRGLEDFRYITIRSVLVRLVYVICVFVFVKKADDYSIYYLLSVLTIVVNACINIKHSKGLVKFSFGSLNMRLFIKPFIILGIYALLTSMYTSFNVTYLGFVTDDTEVGYYTTATKIHAIILSLFTAFTGVLMPRLSSLAANNDRKEFYRLFSKSISLLYIFSFPVMIYSFIYAEDIISLIAGPGFEKSAICLRIIVPNILIIGLEQIYITQGLMSLSKDRAVFINSIIGASVGIISNLLLVPSIQSIGSSFVWIVSEIAVLSSSLFFISKVDKKLLPSIRSFLKNVLQSIPIVCLLVLLNSSNMNFLYNLFVGLVVLFAYYFILLFFVEKDPFVVGLVKGVIRK